MNEILYGEILEPGDDTARQERQVRSKFWATLRKAARAIPYADEVVAAYYCALDPTTPARVRATLLAALAYFVLPIDALPDFMAGIGFTDDITVLLAAISMVGAHISPVHREAARSALADDD
ncbi:MAG: DUF1232 domain-containing protein [Hyphomicrobiales bacterium]|nr:DUF1232 domain-containing protein [Hyphomicrobiales bacterium]